MEQSISQMADNYTVQMCPLHPDEMLNTICIDPTCLNFFQPACYECSREQHKHLIQSMIKLKSCFSLLAENSKEAQYAQLEYVDEQILNHVENISKEYRLIGEKCTQIADNLKGEALEMSKIEDQLYYKCKASNFLGIIFENQQSVEALKKTLAQLKNVLEFSGDQLKFKKPQRTKQRKHQQIQYYTHRIQQNIHAVQNSLTMSQYIKLDDVNYVLLKTQFNDSLNIHEILPGLEFQGDPNCERTQVLCSSESFYKGVHGMVLKILEKCKNQNTFLNIGIMLENVINTHYPKDGAFGAGVCVYTGTRPIQMQQIAGPQLIDAQTGDEIYTEINFYQQTYIIRNLRNGIIYQYFQIQDGFQIKQQMEQNERIRFRISFNGPNSSKLAVIKSF